MRSADDMERAIGEVRFAPSAGADERIVADATAALERVHEKQIGPSGPNIWRTIVKRHWTKLAAAAVIAIVAGVSLTVLDGAATPAYAIEQTIEANRGLRSIHIRIDPAGAGLAEAWAQFDEEGQLLRLRMHFPNSEDGHKEVVWQEDKAEVWFKTKKGATVVYEKEMLAHLAKMLALFDPKVAMERLHEAQAAGKVRIETQRPPAEGDTITLVVTFTDAADRREIYRVNPETKLVEKIEKYRLADNDYELVSRHEYLEYNQEVPPETFVLAIPDDVTRVDTTTQAVGLSKGDLTDHEIAVKVARGFFEALIAKDYAGAGVILSGLPASRMEALFGKMEFLRIISVGDPTPHPNARTRFLQVPCEVELRVEGRTFTKKFTPNIRAVYNQPDRWAIGGGI